MPDHQSKVQNSKKQTTSEHNTSATEHPNTTQQQIIGLNHPELMKLDDVIKLQRSVGNQRTMQLLGIQRKPQQPPTFDFLPSASNNTGNIQREPDEESESERAPEPELMLPTEFDRLTSADKAESPTLEEVKVLLKKFHSSPDMQRRLIYLDEMKSLLVTYTSRHSKPYELQDGTLGRRPTGTSEALLQAAETLLTDVRKQHQIYTEKHSQGKSIKQLREEKEHEGSAKSLFKNLGPLIGQFAPKAGDSGELSVKVAFPVDPTGILSIGGTISFSVSRSEKSVTIGARAGLIASADITIAGVEAEVGGYIEATAETPEKALQAVSYALYRRFEESKVLPRAASNYIWGGETGDKGFKSAEQKAAGTERDVFNDDESSAEMGGYAKIGGYVGIKNAAKLSGEAEYSSGKRYTKESIGDLKKAGHGNASANPGFGNAQEQIGYDVNNVSVSAAVEVLGGFSGGGSVSWFRVRNPKTKAIIDEGWTVDVNASVKSLGIGGAAGVKLVDTMSSLTNETTSLVKTAQNKAQAKQKQNDTSAGNIVTSVQEGGNLFVGLKDVDTSGLEDYGIEMDGDTTLNLSISSDKDGKKSGEFSIGYSHGFKFETSIIGFTATQSHTLLTTGYDGENWVRPQIPAVEEMKAVAARQRRQQPAAAAANAASGAPGGAPGAPPTVSPKVPTAKPPELPSLAQFKKDVPETVSAFAKDSGINAFQKDETVEKIRDKLKSYHEAKSQEEKLKQLELINRYAFQYLEKFGTLKRVGSADRSASMGEDKRMPGISALRQLAIQHILFIEDNSHSY